MLRVLLEQLYFSWGRQNTLDFWDTPCTTSLLAGVYPAHMCCSGEHVCLLLSVDPTPTSPSGAQYAAVAGADRLAYWTRVYAGEEYIAAFVRRTAPSMSSNRPRQGPTKSHLTRTVAEKNEKSCSPNQDWALCGAIPGRAQCDGLTRAGRAITIWKSLSAGARFGRSPRGLPRLP